MSIRLYVGNLTEAVTRQELEEVFLPSDEVVSLKLITDRKTGKCRGFGFLTVTTDEAADGFIEKFNGHAFQEGTLRIELAQPKTPKAEAPTPSPSSPTPAPVLTPRTEGETRRPRPVKAVAPVLRTEKAVVASVAPAPEEVITEVVAAVEAPSEPVVRPQPPVRKSLQTPAARAPRTPAATGENTRGRRTSTTNARSERRQGNSNSVGNPGASYRDLEEVGAIDPRWAVLLEAKKKLELTV